jgi:hypothetical protein
MGEESKGVDDIQLEAMRRVGKGECDKLGCSEVEFSLMKLLSEDNKGFHQLWAAAERSHKSHLREMAKQEALRVTKEAEKAAMLFEVERMRVQSAVPVELKDEGVERVTAQIHELLARLLVDGE